MQTREQTWKQQSNKQEEKGKNERNIELKEEQDMPYSAGGEQCTTVY